MLSLCHCLGNCYVNLSYTMVRTPPNLVVEEIIVDKHEK